MVRGFRVALAAVVVACGSTEGDGDDRANGGTGGSAGAVGTGGGSAGKGGASTGGGAGKGGSGGMSGSEASGGFAGKAGSGGSGEAGSGRGGSGATGGSAGKGGGRGSAGNGAGGSGSADGAGAGGGGMAGAGSGSCPDGLEGIWKLPNYEAYLQVDAECGIPLFCDLVEGHHTTGYVDEDTVVLVDLAMPSYVLMGDTLTLLDAGGQGEDLPFARQPQGTAVPAACL
jgi:hypothetical protein